MPDPVTGAIVGGTSLVSGAMGARAAKKAAQTTADATVRAAEIQQQMYEQGREDLAPYREQGYIALEDIEGMKPYLTQQFASEQALAPYLDPSMAFRMKYGTQATERLANVGQGAISGNTMRGLTEFGQGLASTEYGNAFNRAQTERANIYNTLANIAGMGQNAVNAGVQSGQATAQNIGTLGVGGAQAQAAGIVGAANAYGGAVQNAGNMIFLNQLMKPNPSTVASSGYSGGYAPSVNTMGDGMGTGIYLRRGP
jgi:hypothetical protein